MSDTRLKTLPPLRSDEEAERFVEEADLTEYDLSQFKPMKFHRTGDRDRLSVDIPPKLVSALAEKARALDMTMSEIVGILLEKHLKDL